MKSTWFLKAEITIERPVSIVWEYFTTPEHWVKWWGGEMESAQWREGGEIVWALGGLSKVLEIIPFQRIILSGGWTNIKWEFKAFGSNER